jgi:hypothetical protein
MRVLFLLLQLLQRLLLQVRLGSCSCSRGCLRNSSSKLIRLSYLAICCSCSGRLLLLLFKLA